MAAEVVRIRVGEMPFSSYESIPGSGIVGHGFEPVSGYKPIKKEHITTGWYKQNPSVFVDEDGIKIMSKCLKIGQYYPVSYEGKEYLICKSKKGVIDLYEVIE